MTRPLDRTDHAIISELQADARLSNKELAARVHVAPSTCLERVKRLRDEGVLEGFHARVAPRSLNIGMQAMIAVRLDHHSAGIVHAFQEYLLANPAIIAVYYLAGQTDFMCHVAVRDADQLREIAVDYMTSRPEVANVETSLIFEHRARPSLPSYADSPTTGSA